MSEPHQTLPLVNSLRARDLTLRYFSSFYKCFRRIYKYGMREREGVPKDDPAFLTKGKEEVRKTAERINLICQRRKLVAAHVRKEH